MIRPWLRLGVAGVAAWATVAIAVQFLVVEPAERSAAYESRRAAAQQAALVADVIRQGGAIPLGARVVAVDAVPPQVGGIARLGRGRVVWVAARTTSAVARDVRRRVLGVAAIGVLAVGGWALWSGFVRRRDAVRQLEAVSMVAHDLRSPLTGIGLAADRLATSELPAARAAARAAIDRECLRVGGIADDILSACSSVAAGTECTTEALSHVLEDVAARVRVEHGCEVILEVEPAARIAASDARCARAVANIVENAARHSPSGRPVRLRAAVVDGAAEVVVEDEGDGFGPAFAIGAFERGAGGGRAGLGLASSRRVIHALGGTLRLGRSAAGGGAVSLRLPPPGATR